MRIGSLFSGAGGLDMAVQSVFSGEVIWQSEIDKAASQVLAYRFPCAPNLGDITKIDWKMVETPDVLCLGFPCQDVSSAGKRAGIKHGTRSGLWVFAADAIDALRPQIVVIENVRGLLSAAAHRMQPNEIRGLTSDEAHLMESAEATMGNRSSRPVLRAAGAVLGDLADIGYDAQWTTFAAGDVGAPHRRERVFIVATDSSDQRYGGSAEFGLERGLNVGLVVGLLGSSQSQGIQRKRPRAFLDNRVDDALLPTPTCQDGENTAGPSQHHRNTKPLNVEATLISTTQSHWGKYEPAIRRWESLTRPAPRPTEPNKHGKPRLSPAFSEWLMGWPDGWVTDPNIGISRNQQLRIVGNGVCPQQAAAALRYLMAV